MLWIIASLVGLCWLGATGLLASATYHRIRGARPQATRDLTHAGWLTAAAVVPTVITIAAGSI